YPDCNAVLRTCSRTVMVAAKAIAIHLLRIQGGTPQIPGAPVNFVKTLVLFRSSARSYETRHPTAASNANARPVPGILAIGALPLRQPSVNQSILQGLAEIEALCSGPEERAKPLTC